MDERKLKNRGLKKAIIIGFLSMFLVFFVNGNVFAAPASTSKDIDAGKGRDTSGATNWRCYKKGVQDFMVFLNTAMFSEGFTDSVIEPWKDVLMRNQCQALDVLSLIQQQDKIKSAIRDAYVTCKNEKLPKLVTAYNEMTAEIYYARNVADTYFAAPIPFASLQINPEQAMKTDEVLKAEMKKKFYDKGRFPSEADFNNFFTKISVKYEDQKKSYVLCKKGSWQAVKDKFVEFIKFFKDGMGVKEGFKSWQRKAAKLKETATQGWEWPVKLGVNGQGVNMFGGKDAFMNDLSSAFEGFSENNPFTKDYWTEDIAKGLTFGDTTSFLKSSQLKMTIDDLMQLQGTINQRFYMLYSSTSGDELQKILGSLDDLNKTVKQTPAGPLDQIEKCVDDVNDKQCKNN